MSLCDICTEPFNKKTNSKVSCPKCTMNMCAACCKTYLMNSKEFAHCMNCKTSWDRIFMSNNFPKSWIHREYKNHKENLMEERHNAILYKYQSNIVSLNRTYEYEKLVSKASEEIEQLRKKHYQEMSILYKKRDLLRIWKNNEYDFYIGRRDEQPDPYEILIQRTDNKLDQQKIEEEAKMRREKLMMLRGPCPKDGCKGFISDNWKCEICSTKICRSCMLEVNDTDHVCKEDDIKSAEKIRQDSRNCPKCRIRIFKIEGCDQMWCTNCQTFFSWKTMTILNKGPRHNPHYIDHLKIKKITVLDNHCDIPVHYFRAVPSYSPEYIYFLACMELMYGHANEIRQYNTNNIDMKNVERELAIRYLLNCIDAETRKRELHKKQKAFDKMTDTINVRELWSQQIIGHIGEHFIKNVDVKTTLKNIRDIEIFCRDSMHDIGQWYNSSAPSIRLFSGNEKYDKILNL